MKFYSSVRIEVSKVGGSNVTAKVGGEDIIVGHSIRVKIAKSKVSPPFRKAEFELKYDGKPQSKSEELAGVVLLKGLCAKYDKDGNISPTGRTYKYTLVNDDGEILEELIAKKKDEFADALEKCPLIQAKFLDILKGGLEDEPNFISDQSDADLTDEEFEEKLKNDSEAEEESGWEDLD